MIEITIITFNYGTAGKVVNGPGMCLVNFVKKLEKNGIKCHIFSKINSELKHVKSLNDKIALESAIKKSKYLHHWSGLASDFEFAINLAKKHNLKVMIGPNVIDTVKFSEEQKFLKNISYDKIFTVNLRLKYLIAKQHDILLDKIELLLVGPDEELWSPINKDNGKILWKGNSKQFVKDISFGLSVAKNLPQYEFSFMGYPDPYKYYSHILPAKEHHLYFTTSLSETMGLGLAEQLCAGIPAIAHSKIYLPGENYKTGIITNRDVSSYCEAIIEIMENEVLYQDLKIGATNFIKNTFDGIEKTYLEGLLCM